MQNTPTTEAGRPTYRKSMVYNYASAIPNWIEEAACSQSCARCAKKVPSYFLARPLAKGPMFALARTLHIYERVVSGDFREARMRIAANSCKGTRSLPCVRDGCAV